MESRATNRVDAAEIQHLLDDTSRTFALTVPLLVQPLRNQIGLAYLLFRVADSIEDAVDIATNDRIHLLEQLAESVDAPDIKLPADWQTQAVGLWPEDTKLKGLLQRTTDLLATLDSQPDSVKEPIRRSLRETIGGMIWFLRASSDTDFVISIATLADLRRYCFFVAGIVGEMLTDLFVQQHSVAGVVHAELRKLGRDFGEALQLTNILKDDSDDAQASRRFIPPQADRAEVFQLAYDAVTSAHQYLAILHQERFSTDIIRFCSCPLLLAEETLAVVRQSGPGAKVDRQVVEKIFTLLAEGRPSPHGE